MMVFKGGLNNIFFEWRPAERNSFDMVDLETDLSNVVSMIFEAFREDSIAPNVTYRTSRAKSRFFKIFGHSGHCKDDLGHNES
jgi:hypothetical protein